MFLHSCIKITSQSVAEIKYRSNPYVCGALSRLGLKMLLKLPLSSLNKNKNILTENTFGLTFSPLHKCTSQHASRGGIHHQQV